MTIEKRMNNAEVRPNYLGKVILAFILASIVFILIFVLGYTISYNKYQAVAQSQENLRYSLLSFEVERDILRNSCEDFDVLRFTNELEDMGRVVSLLESRLGKTNPEVLNQKKTYSLLEARHFIYVSDYNQNCNDTIPIVLFFYSNKPEYLDESDKLGYILSSIKSQKPSVLIYSFDFDLDSSLILLLKEKYHVNSPNQLVINGIVYPNKVNNINDLSSVLA